MMQSHPSALPIVLLKMALAWGPKHEALSMRINIDRPIRWQDAQHPLAVQADGSDGARKDEVRPPARYRMTDRPRSSGDIAMSNVAVFCTVVDLVFVILT